MRSGFRISDGGWNRDFNLTTGIDLTPDNQVTSHSLRAFAHAIQPPVSGALLLSRNFGSIPFHHREPYSKLSFVIADFHFDLSGPLRA